MGTATGIDTPADTATFATGYAARDAARLAGIPISQIHAYVRAGCLSPHKGTGNELRFSFQDLVLLRTARSLTAELPPRKVYRALRRLRGQLPRGRAITGVRLTAEGDSIVVRDGAVAWEPESGQALLDFSVSDFAARVEPMARETARAAHDAADGLDAEAWYRIGCDMEPFDLREAGEAYERALALDPGHADSLLNLGRLKHEAGDVRDAEALYRRALDARPGDETAAFNLGVALEDLERFDEARAWYERAIERDPTLIDAHYNLANLFERQGDFHAALRHLQVCRKLQGSR